MIKANLHFSLQSICKVKLLLISFKVPSTHVILKYSLNNYDPLGYSHQWASGFLLSLNMRPDTVLLALLIQADVSSSTDPLHSLLSKFPTAKNLVQMCVGRLQQGQNRTGNAVGVVYIKGRGRSSVLEQALLTFFFLTGG